MPPSNDLQRMQQALIAADKAGDTQAATTLAQAIRQQMSASPAIVPTQTTTESFMGMAPGESVGHWATQTLPGQIGRAAHLANGLIVFLLGYL